MSNEIFVFSIASIGVLGLALAIHLIFFGKGRAPAKILGGYTLLITISSVEPLKHYLDATAYLVELIVGTGSFMIGPMLYLYCKHRISNNMQWERINIVHILPAGMLLILAVLIPAPTDKLKELDVDIILYLLFVCQLFTYTLISLCLILKVKKQHSPKLSLDQFHLNFIITLVISSLILFTYSFVSTIVGLNDSLNFKISIQAFLTLIIIVIVLLNAEALEDHESTHKVERTFRGK